MKHDWFAVAIASLALALSAYSAYRQFFPTDRVTAMVSYAGLQVEEGRFGVGPSLVAAVNLANSGNRTVILTSMTASFGYLEDVKAAPDCEVGAGTFWSGTPWESKLEGQGSSTPLPVEVSPQSIVSGVYSFEANPTKPSTAIDEYELMVCIKYEILGVDGAIYTGRSPIGIVRFDGESILDVRLDDGYRAPLTVVH